MRLSNFELLRIVAMFSILLSHILHHGFGGVEFESSPNFIIHRVIEQFLYVHVNLFLLITGYFGIKMKWRGFSSFLLRCLFYSVAIYLVHSICSYGFSFYDLFGRISFVYSKHPWWFVYIYIQLYLLSPILNVVIKHVTNIQLAQIVVLLLFINCFIGATLKSDFNSNGFTVHHFILMYFIGAFIRRNEKTLVRFKTRLLISVYVLTAAFAFILSNFNFRFGWYGYVNPLVIVGAVCIFIVFGRLKIKSKRINYLASSSFSVYLLHDEDTFVRGQMIKIGDWLLNFSDNFAIYMFPLLFIAILIFFLCIAIDKVVDAILRPITALVNKIDPIEWSKKYISEHM